jgi:hypothetical protein
MKRVIRCPGCGFRVRLLESECPYTCICRRLVSFGGVELEPPPTVVKPPATCVHLGPEVRQQVCDTCAGKQRIKIFGCTIYGDCTLGKKLDGLACCATCPDYSPP